MSNLKIVITGLCAFVKLSPTQVRVVFPNFTQFASVHDEAIVPPHSAFLAFHRRDRILPHCGQAHRARRPQNFEVLPRSSPSAKRRFLLLDREVITLRRVGGPAGGPVEHLQPERLIEMNRVIDDHFIDDSLVSDEFDPDPRRVTAWLDITTGELAPKSGSRTLEFRPRVKEDPYRGDFAERVVWRLPGAVYDLESRAFGSTAKPQPQWRIDATNRPIVMMVGNAPLDELVNPESPAVLARKEEPVDHHFHRFYELCATEPESHPLPHVISSRRTSIRFMGGNCPPVRFEK